MLFVVLRLFVVVVLVVCCLLLVVRLLFVVRCALSFVCCPLVGDRCLLCDVRSGPLLFVVRWSLLVVGCVSVVV